MSEVPGSGSAPTLETPRLRLRPFRADDFAPCHALWNDPRVYRHIGGRPSSEREVWERLLRYAGLWALCGYGYWAIEDPSGTYLGEAGLADFRREFAEPPPPAPETGWMVSPGAWGRGVATEAMTAILRWADGHVDQPETFCIIDAGNAASIRVAGKLGYRPAGSLSLGDTQPLHFRRSRL